jgi:hypothetical protein
MNPSGAAILIDPHPCSHIVYPYTDENLVGQAVCVYASAGLRAGESVILIMTTDHYEPIRRRLQAEGLDPDEHERMGRLVCLKTEDLLTQLVTDGSINESLFKFLVGRLITRARQAAGDRYLGKVRLFGEMVSQLRNTNLAATTRLEELWNEVINAHSVPLFCTYALTHRNEHFPHALNDLHSHNLERETPLIQ